MVQIGRTGTLVVRDVKLQHDFDSQDCFIYCLSHQYSADMYGLFGDADMCLEITDPDNFFLALHMSLKKFTP